MSKDRFEKLTELLDKKHIEYRTRGVNVSKGNVNIKCPWCGHDDPSFHLGIEPNKGVYGCRRNPTHKGYISNLFFKLRFTREETKPFKTEFSKERTPKKIKITENKDFYLHITDEIPSTFRNFKTIPVSLSHLHVDYLYDRNLISYYDNNNYPKVCEMLDYYGILWDDYRMIFVCYDENNQPVSYTARDITGNSEIKYKSSKNNKEWVYNYNNVYNDRGKILVLTEGAIDTLRCDNYSRSMAIRFLSLFSTSITDHQSTLINRLSDKYQKLIILLDSDVDRNISQNIANRFVFTYDTVKVANGFDFSENYTDPGDLDMKSLIKMMPYLEKL